MHDHLFLYTVVLLTNVIYSLVFGKNKHWTGKEEYTLPSILFKNVIVIHQETYKNEQKKRYKGKYLQSINVQPISSLKL